MTRKIVYELKGGYNLTQTNGKIIEIPFGSAIKSFFVLAQTGSGIVSTDTLQVTVSEVMPGLPNSNETPTKINYGYAGNVTPLIAHIVVTGSQLNSGGQTMPLYDVRDFTEQYNSGSSAITSYTGSVGGGLPKVMSTILAAQWNITGSGNWNFRHILQVSD